MALTAIDIPLFPGKLLTALKRSKTFAYKTTIKELHLIPSRSDRSRMYFKETNFCGEIFQI